MTTKKVSIIIANYNGLNWLKKLLPNLTLQSYKNIEIVVVDNNSQDASTSFLTKVYPLIKVIRLNDNTGFAYANNIGVSNATGDYIILLNNDTIVPKNYVENFIKVFENYPLCGVAQSKIVYLSDEKKIDSCGSFFTSTTLQYYIGNNKSSEEKIYNIPRQIFSTKGASMVIKKEVIQKTGLFEQKYWSYYEETDFCHRALMLGYQVWYWPIVTIKHSVGGTSTKFANSTIQFHNFKNKAHSLLTNLEKGSLLKYYPRYVCCCVLIIIGWILNGKWLHIIAMINAHIWVIKNANSIRIDRKIRQKIRKVSDENIFKVLLINPDIRYYWSLFNNNLQNYSDKL